MNDFPQQPAPIGLDGNSLNPPQKYWFKALPYGMKVIPVTLEGWGVSLFFSGLILGAAWYNGFMDESNTQEVSFVPFIMEVIVLLFVYMRIIHKRTEGGLKWRWGAREESR